MPLLFALAATAAPPSLPPLRPPPSASYTPRRDLPARATDAMELRNGDVGLHFTPRGVRPVSAVFSAAGARYPGAWPGADLEYRVVAGGVEDLVAFQTRPELERVVYDVVLDGVSGLRLIDDVLELLDGTGTPRLRVRAPFVDAADGARHRARLDLLDCAADRDPRPPWGRPVTPPGADHCTVQVSWGDAVGSPLPYPVVVDPGWVRADTMVTPRNAHVAVQMADGRVLIAGGFDAFYATNYIADAEVFDPATLTFAVTSPMVHARGRTGGAALATGEALVASGDDAALATAERWDPATGSWTETSPMAEPRDWVEVAGLPDGRVLVVGGCTAYSATCTTVSDEGEVYDPISDTWTTTGAMTDRRAFFTLTPLLDGRVAAVGGCRTFAAGFACYTTNDSVDVFDPATDAWTRVADLALGGHQDHAAAGLATGELLVMGGSQNGYLTRTAQRWDPLSDTWQVVGSVRRDHASAGAAALPSGGALVAGHGWFTLGDDVEVYDPVLEAFDLVGPLSSPRTDMPVLALADGRVLVVGGLELSPYGAYAESGAAALYDESCTDDDLDWICDDADRCLGGDDRVDGDADEVPDDCDLCPNLPDPAQGDADGDGLGDVCDVCPDPADGEDTDGDTVCDNVDRCPGFPDQQDSDNDGVPTVCDLCPTTADPDQADADQDGSGDACDLCPTAGDPVDTDGDTVCDGVDTCPDADDLQDADADGRPDACDPCPIDPLDDRDGDGRCDSEDPCPTQVDNSGPDRDGDGFPDHCDVCPEADDDQLDQDGDGFGDACDCGSSDPDINPDGVEVCNGRDDDCDGVDDEDATDAIAFYADRDGDRRGDPSAVTLACVATGNLVADASDCDDTDASRWPGAVERCDGVDNDCDGVVDPDCEATEPPGGGCGCNTSPPSGVLLLGLWLPWVLRRRAALEQAPPRS